MYLYQLFDLISCKST